MRCTWRFGRPGLGAAVILAGLGLPRPAVAQHASDMRRIAALPTAEQQTPATQGQLQAWYMRKVAEFQRDRFAGTALGRSGLFSFGDFTRYYPRVWSPPTGTGTCRFLWGEVATPATLDDITFPRDPAGIGKYATDGRTNTPWHEFQHILMIGRDLQVRQEDWTYALDPPIQNWAPDHAYIEGLGERFEEWLEYLLVNRQFEALLAEGGQLEREFRKGGLVPSWFDEHHFWAKAQDAWSRAWPAGQRIAAMPKILRDEYRNLTGIVIPFPEQVVAFYMNGGVKDTAGRPVKVPEWVFWPAPMQSAVIVGHRNDRKVLGADVAECSFDVQLLESYRFNERTRSLNHGKALIRLEGGDGVARLEVTARGGAVKPGPDGAFVVDLKGFGTNEGLQIVFKRPGLAALQGTRRYTVAVRFKDDPRLEGGVEKPSFYYSQTASYFVDVTGRKAAPAAAPATGAGSSSTPGLTPLGAGEWVLERTWNEVEVRDKAFSFDLGPGRATSRVQRRKPAAVRDVDIVTSHAWTVPPAVLKPGENLPITVSIQDAGTTERHSAQTASIVGTTAHTMVDGKYFTPPGSFDDYLSIGGPVIKSADGRISGYSVGILPGFHTDRVSNTLQIPIKKGIKGRRLLLQVKVDAARTSDDTRGIVNYEYVFRPGGQAPPPVQEPGIQLSAQEPPRAPEPAPMDNQPPAPGELVPVRRETVRPPARNTRTGGRTTAPAGPGPRATAPPAAASWYVQAQGGYRLPLAPGWKVLRENPDRDLDTLLPAEEDLAVFCGRSRTQVSQSEAGAVLEKAAAGLLRDQPGSTRSDLALGPARGLRVDAYDPKDRQTTVHLYFVLGGHAYHISLALPPGQGRRPVPAKAWTMLNGLLAGAK